MSRRPRWHARGARLLGTVLAAPFRAIRLAFPLPPLAGRVRSTAIAPSERTTLGASVLPLASAHPGASGVMALEGGVDAFAARMALIHAAEASIDLQYYIWQDDLTGLRILSELAAAAARGVRVRLLVDDVGTQSLDRELLQLSRMPMTEVRLFNPFALRRPRLLNYLFDFARLNRRMHNKSFTVDGVATIVGGRNIGDLYFETGDGHFYSDFDVLALGPAAQAVGADFDRYWNSASAYPVQSLVSPARVRQSRLATGGAAGVAPAPTPAIDEVVRASTLYRQIRDRSLPVEWAAVRLFSDDPAKALGRAAGDGLMARALMAEIGRPAAAFDVISAYFVPGDEATDSLAHLARSGVRVRTLTNALEATDVAPVHSGYVGYRGVLVDAGVEVWELKGEGGERKRVDDLGIKGISRTALHAKTFQVDGRRAFIGSFNFDPRSRRLNSEMGLLIDSPALAAMISAWLDRMLPTRAYRVRRAENGRLVWIGGRNGRDEVVWTSEPNTTWPLRAAVWAIALLPVEWLL